MKKLPLQPAKAPALSSLCAGGCPAQAQRREQLFQSVVSYLD